MRIPTFPALVLAAATALVAAPAAQTQDVYLRVSGGRVTLMADNVALRQILDEWSRVTGAEIIGGNRLSAEPVTMRLVDVTERDALATILRDAPGFILVSRPAGQDGRSTITRIVIAAGTAASAAPSARPRTGPAEPPPLQVPPPPTEDASSLIVFQDPPQSPADVEEPSSGAGGGTTRVGRISQGGSASNAGTAPGTAADTPDAASQPSTNRAVRENPFGVKSGSSRPGTIAPVPAPPSDAPPLSSGGELLADPQQIQP